MNGGPVDLPKAEILQESALACQNAYLEHIPENAVPLSDDHAFRGYVQLTPFGTLVAIKGTADVRDFIRDAEVYKGIFKTKTMGHFLVHSGFLFEYELIWPLLAEMRLNPPVILTGHSLGGGIATLLKVSLWEKEIDTQVYTFGSPRVGGWEFAASFDAISKGSVRVVHDMDLVPRIPKLGYWHVGGLLRVKDNGVVLHPAHSWLKSIWEFERVALSDLTLKSLQDHHVSRYVSSIGNYLERLRRKS